MNKIRIIDLLNKIANGEEVPRKVKYGGIIYTYQRVNKHCLQYENMKESDIFWRYLTTNASDVNDKVEIIEEQEEIDIQELEDVNLFDNGQNFNDMPIIIKSYDDNFTKINNTINKLVQAVKQLDKNIKEDKK